MSHSSLKPVPVVTAALIASILLISTQQASAAVCTERKKFTHYLSKQYKEKPKAVGLVSNTSIMEVYVSKKGTWSILMTNRKGITCLIAAGNNWENLKLAKASTPS